MLYTETTNIYLHLQSTCVKQAPEGKPKTDYLRQVFA